MINEILALFQNLPEHLQMWATNYGPGLYLILGLILFAETGLVVAPLLPGDSLLFATGAILALNLPGLNIFVMGIVMILAVFLGDVTNYSVGRWFQRRVLKGGEVRWLNKRHLEKTQEFYARHGGRTVILARFVPIVRTYAPFVAGVSGMPFSRFIGYSFAGSLIWIISFLSLGYFFGNIPSIKTNFHYVILAILILSVMPIAIEFIKEKRKAKASAA